MFQDVTPLGSGKSVTYQYDGNDLKVKRISGAEETRFIFDGMLPIMELDGRGNIMATYTNNGSQIISKTVKGQTFYYLPDLLGTVREMTNGDGDLVNSYQYDAFGQAVNAEEDPMNSLHFVGTFGGFHDAETGLINFWHRWYEPETGRWITRDPIGIVGGINSYCYIYNSPLKYIDTIGFLKNEYCKKMAKIFHTWAPDYSALQLLQNAKLAYKEYRWDSSETYGYYESAFSNQGIYDYARSDNKNAPLHAYGNINFGVMMAASGFSEVLSQEIAGNVRQKSGRHPEQGTGDIYNYPYGNIPEAAIYIHLGYEYYKKCLEGLVKI